MHERNPHMSCSVSFSVSFKTQEVVTSEPKKYLRISIQVNKFTFQTRVKIFERNQGTILVQGRKKYTHFSCRSRVLYLGRVRWLSDSARKARYS